MKTNEYKTLLSKYYKGETNKSEENWLKEFPKADPQEKILFETLKKEKSDKMDWNFDDFLAKANEENKIKKNERNHFGYGKIFGIAASFILIFSLALFFQKTEEKPNTNIAQQTISNIKNTTKSVENIEKVIEKETPKIIEKINNIEQIAIPKTKSIAIKTPKKEKTVTPQNELKNDFDYHSGDIVMDGVAIKSEEEAIEIFQASMILLSDNFKPNLQAINVVNSTFEKLSEL